MIPEANFIAPGTLNTMRSNWGGSWIGGIGLGAVAILAGMGRTPASDTRPGRVLGDFPLIRQPDPISCGPACIAMMLRYYRAEEDAAVTHPQELRSRVRLMAPRGLATALAVRGIAASVQKGDLGLLVKDLNQGRPPILLVRLSPYMWHYVVAIGYQGLGERFRLADPLGNVDWIDAEDLDRSWAFDGDLRGHRLEEQPCGVCAGGHRAPQCTFCDGTGKAPDTARKVVEAMELTPHLLIVPDQAPPSVRRPSTP